MSSISVDAILEQLRGEGSRVTTARRILLAAIVDSTGHPTAQELLEAVHAVAPDVHASTVYRNLEELERLGVVVHTHLGHGPATYHLAADAHAHLVCERCGATIEAGQDLFAALVEGARRQHGFVLRPYHFAVLGICARCAGEDGRAAAPRDDAGG